MPIIPHFYLFIFE